MAAVILSLAHVFFVSPGLLVSDENPACRWPQSRKNFRDSGTRDLLSYPPEEYYA